MTETQRKAANKRKREARKAATPPVKTETLVITAEQFLAGIKKLTDGFATIERLEKIVLAGRRDDAPPNPDAGAYPTPRETPAHLGKAVAQQSGPPPLQDLLGEAARKSSQVLDKALAIKHRVLNGDVPTPSIVAGGENQADYGPAKNEALYTLHNLSDIDVVLDFLASYFIS